MSETPVQPIDPYGMQPRTVLAQRQGYVGEIAVAVPLTYLRGLSDRCHDNLRFSIRYEITPRAGYSNHVDPVQVMACHRDYATPASLVNLIADDTVIQAIKSVLDYFAYIRRVLSDECGKNHPMGYEQWRYQ